MLESEKISTISKYACWSIILGPLFEPYNLIGSVNMYKFFMLFNCVFFFFHRKGTVHINKSLKIFLLYAFTVPTFIALLFGYTSHLLGSYLTVILFVADLFFTLPHLNFKYLLKIYGYVVTFAICFFVFQELQYFILGHRTPGLIPFLKLASGNIDMSDQLRMLSNTDRSASIFAEPSHFAQYIIPCLALCMGDNYNNKKLFDWRSIAISLCLFWLRSGNGLLLCASLWLVFIIFSSIKPFLKYLIIIPFCVVISIVAYNKLSSTEVGDELLSRTSELEIEGDRVSSGTIRLYRGYFVYFSAEPIVQILGAGLGGKDDVIDNSPYSWMFRSDEHYLNTIQLLLISYGVVGAVLFFIFLFGLIKGNSFGGKLVILAFIVLSAMESVFCSPKMLIYISIPLLIKSARIKDGLISNENISINDNDK